MSFFRKLQLRFSNSRKPEHRPAVTPGILGALTSDQEHFIQVEALADFARNPLTQHYVVEFEEKRISRTIFKHRLEGLYRMHRAFIRAKVRNGLMPEAAQCGGQVLQMKGEARNHGSASNDIA